MMRFLIIALALLASSRVEAAPKKYHFKLAAVTAKDHVKPPEVASAATKRVEGQIKKTFTSHAQLVATLDGAPDPIANADAFRKFLKKKGLAGAYLVTVEVTGASEEVEPMPDKPNSQRLV
ncbi:MAG: hypothetical protein AB7O24_32090, partial [Kofleriaceae bacterium]